ncbi:MAG TPA: arabinan endo-1,5-alpha-L-arabinosidase [Phnomibacter sp.]|nr:arabinan endo-1,5-alpha-L-arabinosidase [Phnomibacter sp.]
MKKYGWLLCTLLLAVFSAKAQRPEVGKTYTNIGVHDPVMIQQGDTYFLFCTGTGIARWSSKDLKNWTFEKSVFATAPPWAVDTIPGFKNHIWAPDISYHNGLYYLYYSVSAFGKNTSAIGVATTPTLFTSDSNYKWTDHGRVIQSYPGITNWNAIDPNIIAGSKGRPYMMFGSFWDGLQLVRLSKNRLQVDGKPETIASRKAASSSVNPLAIDDNPKDAGGNAIEAPFIFKKNNYYYLFASIDYCCKGPKSTYKMIVGRSKKIEGPYLDKEGKSMATGGGSLVLQGNENWYGVGHNAVCSFNNTDYLIFHGYDAKDNGKSKLLIKPLSWDANGWPVARLDE